MIFIEKQKKIIENMFRVSEGVNPSMVGGGGALGHAGVHKVLKSSILIRTIAKPVIATSDSSIGVPPIYVSEIDSPLPTA